MTDTMPRTVMQDLTAALELIDTVVSVLTYEMDAFKTEAAKAWFRVDQRPYQKLEEKRKWLYDVRQSIVDARTKANIIQCEIRARIEDV